MEATLTPQGYRYLVSLNREEHRALAWLADRYTTAEMLYDRCDIVGSMGSVEVWRIDLSESEAWEYRDALAEENGNADQTVPTCAGGTLAEKLANLYDAII